jgi:Fic family protein
LLKACYYQFMEEKNTKNKPLKKPLNELPKDREEIPARMEPLIPSEESRMDQIDDLALKLVSESVSLKSSMPPALVMALSDLVRSINCYYSNLIEGHDTHPIDIEKALKKDYSENPEQRNLQVEAEAHIAVQRWIDEEGMVGSPMTLQNIQEVHRRFCELLPDALQWVVSPDTKEKIRIVPGELRHLDVKVGSHYAISPGAVPRFLCRFEDIYSNHNKSTRILAAAAAHHRLLWIHPFLDGNGRVARLMSYACLLESLDTGGVWSIARGLARKQDRYKEHLIECDQLRRGDYDGRGSLSQSALDSFTKFFLETCIDQIQFMRSLVRPDQLRKRIIAWANDEMASRNLPPRTPRLLESLLNAGELSRGDVPSMLDLSPPAARRVIAALADKGVIVSASSRAPIKLAFPAHLASAWLPGLFPDK